jgi:outer membrane protein assembly factor BamB
MKKIFWIIFPFIFAFCSKVDDTKDKNGIVTSKKDIWSASVTDDDKRANNFLFKSPIVYNSGVLVKSRENSNNLIKMFDINSGKQLWKWNDFLEKNEQMGLQYPFLEKNCLTWTSDYSTYKVNLNDGITLWKKNLKENYNYWSFGMSSLFFVSHLTNRDSPPIAGGGRIIVFDNSNGNFIESFKPAYDTLMKTPFENCGWAYQGFPVPFAKGEEIFILLHISDVPPSCQSVGKDLISLYNFTKKEWVYQRKKLLSVDGSFGIPHPSIIANDKVYHSSVDIIVCHDLMTGEKQWEAKLPQKGNYFQSAGLLVRNDKVYANSDGGQLFCINAQNGNILWEIRSSGSSTVLSYLNGVVYFVGGGDGKLHAVDAETGEYLWKIESPDLGKNKLAVFSGLCAVVPGVGSEKGKIVVTTGLNAYCYEVLR